LLTSTRDVVRRWREYFEDLLNPTDTRSENYDLYNSFCFGLFRGANLLSLCICHEASFVAVSIYYPGALVIRCLSFSQHHISGWRVFKWISYNDLQSLVLAINSSLRHNLSLIESYETSEKCVHQNNSWKCVSWNEWRWRQWAVTEKFTFQWVQTS